jgi:hypothetical protein
MTMEDMITRTSLRVDETQHVAIWEEVQWPARKWGQAHRLTWQPTKLIMEFVRDRSNGGDWDRWTYLRGHLHGYNVKAGGVRGADRVETVWTYESKEDSPEGARVRAVVEELRAHPDQVTPFRDTRGD